MPSLDNAALVRLTWLGTAFVVLGLGLGAVWWPSSQTIEQVRGHAREMYEEANNNDALVRRASELRAAQSRVRADLELLGGVGSAGVVTAAALRLLGYEAQQRGVEIRSILPSSTSATSSGPFVGTDVAIGVRGPFRNIVSLIADLPRHDVLIEVHDAELVSSDQSQKLPALDVTLHTTFYRLTFSNSAKASNSSGANDVRTL